MKRLWLLFAQTVTIALALWFVVGTLKPEWLGRSVGQHGPTPTQAAKVLPHAHV